MTDENQARPAASAPIRPLLFFPLVCLFVGSGCAALIYEIVWFQLLELVIGSSAVSLGVLLATFMGGMCLGSLMLPRLVSPWWNALYVVALIELGIGLIAIAVLFGLPYVGGVYVAYAWHGFPGILLRGALSAVLLLPPTLLMGATLPAIARWTQTTANGVLWLGILYSATSPAPCSAACSPASTCFECTTWRRQPTSPPRSTVLSPRPRSFSRRKFPTARRRHRTRCGRAAPRAPRPCMRRSHSPVSRHLAPRWCGRGCFRCSSAPRSIPSPSSSRFSCSVSASVAAAARSSRAASPGRGSRSASLSCCSPRRSRGAR